MIANLKFIGKIETPFHTIDECPRNISVDGPECKLILEKEYTAGLSGLVNGQEILILYWLGEADRSILQQNSRRTGKPAGVFAIRTPNRPNPIGAAVIRIEKISGNEIFIKGLDCLNGTPLVDIKPAILSERIDPNSPNQFFK